MFRSNPFKTLQTMKVLSEQYPYRFCEDKDRGFIQKYSYITKRYTLMYECDSPLQLLTAIDDINYTRWLDPEGVPCYRQQRGDVVSGHRS